MKLVIFDCDGTIVDSQNAIMRAMGHAFDATGLATPPRRAVLDIVGLSLNEAFARLAPAISQTKRALLADHYRDAFTLLRNEPGSEDPLYDGARDVIEALAARDDMVLGIATGKSVRGVERLFKAEGFASCFATVQTADHHPSKPHPAMIELAMREVGAAPGDTVMIGDTTYDIEMAVNAGVKALGVSWGYHPTDWLVESGAHAVAHDYDDVVGHVDALLSAAPGGSPHEH